jgi:hypothetical protein
MHLMVIVLNHEITFPIIHHLHIHGSQLSFASHPDGGFCCFPPVRTEAICSNKFCITATVDFASL